MFQQTHVARHQRRGRKSEHLPERKIPWHDGEYRSDRLVADVALLRRRHYGLVRQESLGIFSVIAAGRRALGRFVHGCAIWFAHLESHQSAKGLFFLFDNISRAQHHGRPL